MRLAQSSRCSFALRLGCAVWILLQSRRPAGGARAQQSERTDTHTALRTKTFLVIGRERAKAHVSKKYSPDSENVLPACAIVRKVEPE